MALLSGMDALSRYALSKFNDIAAMPANSIQLLLNGASATLGTGGIISKPIGNPTSIDVFVHPTVTTTLAIFHSFDGVFYIHDTTQDIAMTAGTDVIKTIKGASFIKLVPTLAQTSGFLLYLSAKF
jgi:hypothetical protein